MQSIFLFIICKSSFFEDPETCNQIRFCKVCKKTNFPSQQRNQITKKVLEHFRILSNCYIKKNARSPLNYDVCESSTALNSSFELHLLPLTFATSQLDLIHGKRLFLTLFPRIHFFYLRIFSFHPQHNNAILTGKKSRFSPEKHHKNVQQ